ncbi:hypothetical protein TEA_000224 [Camellia sinensis var. sinensis]|uniref:protein geranylgeranyltransferase type II n=1 Tax=Camellia sinensis var. sinensis TaxID=542762 RepID=A0A4S4E518_CAMSN|nr:hypothetical protein TEA_000224 [Camellia sinensis var. sinensis]
MSREKQRKAIPGCRRENQRDAVVGAARETVLPLLQTLLLPLQERQNDDWVRGRVWKGEGEKGGRRAGGGSAEVMRGGVEVEGRVWRSGLGWQQGVEVSLLMRLVWIPWWTKQYVSHVGLHLIIVQVLVSMGELEVEKHANYILSVEKKKDDFESVVMEHLRINGAYWGLTTLDLLGKIDEVNSEEVVSWVMKCQHESGGFGGNIGHDPHLLYTLSAIQVLALFDKTNILDIDKVSNYIAGLQNDDGSFSGDMWGEVDTRFSYIAICSLALLHHLNKINVDKAVKYIVSCKNLDGGFGCTPGAESHAGQTIERGEEGWGFFFQQSKKMKIKELAKQIHGRSSTFVALIARLDQVCYSWWVLSSLIIIDRVHWIDKEKLVKYILDCQDKEKGGISDRPDDAVDVFHTYFGVADDGENSPMMARRLDATMIHGEGRRQWRFVKRSRLTRSAITKSIQRSLLCGSEMDGVNDDDGGRTYGR